MPTELYENNLIPTQTLGEFFGGMTSSPFSDSAISDQQTTDQEQTGQGISEETVRQIVIKRVDSVIDSKVLNNGKFVNPRIVGAILVGCSFISSYNSARIEIFPSTDPTIGFVSYSAVGGVVFETIIAGTDIGDVIIGNYAGSAGAKWDQSAGTFDIKGIITATSGTIGGWTINPTTLSAIGIILDSGNQKIQIGATTPITIDGIAKDIESDNYVSGVFGAGFHLDSNLLEVGNIACRGLIRTAVFQKDVVNVMGGNFAVLAGDVLDADMTALDNSTLTTKGIIILAVNDILRIKDGVDDEWLQVTNIASAPVYTVTRDKASVYGANTNPAWKKGATIVNYGQSGDGGVYMTASDSNAPYLSIFDHAGSPWSTINTRLRIGNLNGYLGYVTDLYGIAIGETTKYLKYDPTNGLVIRGNITADTGTFTGTINATAGYFGNGTNGITIDSNGIVIAGTGYIKTSSGTGYRLEILHTIAGGFTDGMVSYDSSNNEVFRLIASGGWPCITIFERTGNVGGMQILGTTTGNTFTQFYVYATGLEDAVTITTGGSTARSGLAGLKINLNSDNGNGIIMKRNSAAIGDMQYAVVGTVKKANFLTITNEGSGWSAMNDARITNEGYIQFPAYYHRSDFDETAAALASTVIANAYWVGGGTSGTKTIVDDARGNNTCILLSTTNTASRSSTIIFRKYIAIDERCVEFRARITDKTNTAIHMGFYDGSANYSWFNFDTAIDANKIYAECYAGSSVTRTDTGVTMSTTQWNTYRIMQYQGSYTYFYINDVLVATITNNTSSSGMKPYAYIDNKSSAEEKLLYIDVINFWKGRNKTSNLPV